MLLCTAFVLWKVLFMLLCFKFVALGTRVITGMGKNENRLQFSVSRFSEEPRTDNPGEIRFLARLGFRGGTA